MNLTLRPAARTDLLVRCAIGTVIAAQAVVTVLSLTFSREVNPIRDPVSDYALHRASRAWFALAVLLALAGAGALALAARVVAMPVSAGAAVLFGLWAIALVTVLVFRGNASAAEATVHGEVHRVAGAVLFGTLPSASVSLSRQLLVHCGWERASVRVRTGAVIGLVTAFLFGAAQFVPALPQGLLERIALLAELAILVTVARAIQGAAK
ncbi:DUF998 domain-containing protein [Amycolatopsis orientalis]|uniref:DUF998 domain-containing protein n=1 Tax=Amycolatopsis orientalis TaxID=31958 RepID=UPI001F1CDA01|nr:DUF998 domain-containing protein [Amycolatopsis orientalis]